MEQNQISMLLVNCDFTGYSKRVVLLYEGSRLKKLQQAPSNWMNEISLSTTFKARRVFFVVCISSPITFLFILKKKKLCVFIWICVHSRFLLLLFFTTPFSGMLKSCPFNNFFTSCLHILLWFPIFQKCYI